MNKTILVIEDSHDTQSEIKRLLSSFQITILQATSANDAMTIIKQHKSFLDLRKIAIDAILLDFNLPDMNGHQCLIEMTGHSKQVKKIPVLVMTAADDGDSISRTLASQFTVVGSIQKNSLEDSLISSLVTSDIIAPPTIRKVVVVDDNNDMRTLMMDQVNAVIYTQAIGFQSGSEALSYLESQPDADLILLDQQMPGMTGTDFLAYKNSNKALKGIPVVMCTTAMEDDPEFDHAKSNGWILEFLPKMLSSQDIERILSHINH